MVGEDDEGEFRVCSCSSICDGVVGGRGAVVVVDDMVECMRRSSECLDVLVDSTAATFFSTVEDYVHGWEGEYRFQHDGEVVYVQGLVLPLVAVQGEEEELRSIDAEEVQGKVVGGV